MLNDGNQLPAIGLGTFPMRRGVLDYAVSHFLKRNTKKADQKLLLDSARDYGNESDLGDSLSNIMLKDKNVRRENLFVTTKIGNAQQMLYAKGLSIEKDIECSLVNLKLDYVDLLLMHWPFPELYEKTWKLMERVHRSGMAKSIGVCNFQVRHLKRLLDFAELLPAVNQIEVHPLRTGKNDVEFCKLNRIQVQAYCPLGLMDDRIKENKLLKLLSAKYRKSIAQIILRWDYQSGIASVPKSSTADRIGCNFDIFDFRLTESEIAEIDSLNEDYKFYSESFYCPGY